MPRTPFVFADASAEGLPRLTASVYFLTQKATKKVNPPQAFEGGTPPQFSLHHFSAASAAAFAKEGQPWFFGFFFHQEKRK